MKASSRHFVLCRTAIAIAVLAACGATRAESTAQGSVSVGAGAVSGNSADRSLFGQYNGMRNESGYGLLDFSYYRFDPDTGRVVDALGSNLGLDTRELQFGWKKQGDWKFLLDYNELTRRDPYTINTGLANAGSTAPQTSYLANGVGTGADLGLKTKRTRLGLTMSKWIGSQVEVEVSLTGEKKEGARLFGIGMNCGSVVAPGCPGTDALTSGAGILLLPEPIDSNHGQIEARVNYAGAKLHISGGYYGSFFNNQYTTLNPSVSGPLNNALGSPLAPSAALLSILNSPVALAPDNQAHQVDLTGNYAFTPATRANFKLAYGQATQKQDFVGFTGVPAGVTNLGARVDTTLALLGITSRPLPKLSLQAEARWEDRDDKTPLALYNVVGSGGYAYTNLRLPNTKTRG
ncbi:MAG: MtrB/PioB family decaheme-associated outer membrane protein, partial [Gemmatimonadota bacterium]